MTTLTVKTQNLYTGELETSQYRNIKGFLDDFSRKNLYNQGRKVIDEQLQK